MAVIIALGNDKQLGFIDFQLFPGLEETDLGSLKRRLEILEGMWLQFCIR